MIIADLNIICINQKKKRAFIDKARLTCEAHNRNRSMSPVYATDNFGVADGLKGWWYTYLPSKAYFFDSPFFDLNLRDNDNAVELNPQWNDLLCTLLSFFIKESPCGTIGFLIRLQDKSDNMVHGKYCLEEFMQELRLGNIRYNELYFIS